METHKLENEQWVEKMRVENDEERTTIAEIKVTDCTYRHILAQYKYCIKTYCTKR